MDQIRKRPDLAKDQFSADAGKSYTIPARIYHDPQFLEDEKRHIFWRNWIFVGHVTDLEKPGDYITAEFTDQRLFVIRTAEGELKAFFNVCQHRGHSLLKGRGTAKKAIVCPYHAWAYDHEGHLIAARNCDQVAGFERGEFSLPGIRVDTLGGFLFVNLDPNARPMCEVYPGAEEALKSFSGDTTALRATRSVPFDIKGNWKNVADNLLECYHCAASHKAFVDLVEMDTYTVELQEYWSIQHGICRPNNTAYDFPADADNRFVALYLWPSMAWVGLPGARGVNVFSFHPLNAELTHQDFTYYHPGGPISATEEASFKYFEDVLGPEDVWLVEDVQKGLHSLGYHQGRIMVDPKRSSISEHALHHFQNLVVREMKDFL
ncbi:MAG: Rieske 2Fe-2S domain-containing protein [Hyphomicrobiales bacterium]